MNRAPRFKQYVRRPEGGVSWYDWGFVTRERFEPPLISNGSFENAIKTSFQATELKDREGREIYEGDILEMEIGTAIGIVRAVAVMIWRRDIGAFSLDLNTKYDLGALAATGQSRPPKIIGNLIDTPELIPKVDSILGG